MKSFRQCSIDRGDSDEEIAPHRGARDRVDSVQRVRRALAVTPPASFLNLHEYVHVIAEAPEVSLFGDFNLFSGPVPFGPPTHYDRLKSQHKNRAHQTRKSTCVHTLANRARSKFLTRRSFEISQRNPSARKVSRG